MSTSKIAVHQQNTPPKEFQVDLELMLNFIDGEWFRILYYFSWESYREFAAAYYDALQKFNLSARLKSPNHGKNKETKEEAKQRLLFERVTMCGEEDTQSNIIYKDNVVELKKPTIDPFELAPGVVPNRMFGRTPKCFFSLLKCFLGTPLMGSQAEPEEVGKLLYSNPIFASVCGFIVKDNSQPEEYDYRHVPSLRKLQQFDQIMTQAGIWEQIKVADIKMNLESGVIKYENELVGDTTHYHGYSVFETVPYVNEKGKEKKKSQSKLTKNCYCKDRNTCYHEWQLTDDGAGTIVKSKTKMYWGHKASIIGFPKQGLIIDVVAITDSATHDGQTFFPHVKKVFEQYPEIRASISRVLYDSACNDAALKERFYRELQVELKASLNPRGAKPTTENLPRGIEQITPYGVPICLSNHEFDYKGIRHDRGQFIYEAPLNDDDISVCIGCPQRSVCCNRSVDNSSRTITVPFETLPHIDPTDPPMAKRFKAIMKRRPSVERMIKRIKCDLGDAHLTKRGNESFQAYLDKTVIAYHLLIRHLH